MRRLNGSQAHAHMAAPGRGAPCHVAATLRLNSDPGSQLAARNGNSLQTHMLTDFEAFVHPSITLQVPCHRYRGAMPGSHNKISLALLAACLMACLLAGAEATRVSRSR